jgi:tRNA(fMet)-specific endonuclease VapC
MDSALLDTDIVNEVLKRKNTSVVTRAADYLLRHGQFAISSMSRYELLRGLKEKNAVRQLAQFSAFCRHSLILAITDDVLDRAADLWVESRRIGRATADADLLIAATALEHHRILATGNTRHFSWVTGLELDDWRSP